MELNSRYAIDTRYVHMPLPEIWITGDGLLTFICMYMTQTLYPLTFVYI